VNSAGLCRLHLARTAAVIVLAVAVEVAGYGCNQIPPDPGLDVAPSRDVGRAWIPPATVTSANETTSGRDELKTLGSQFEQSAPPGAQYDLPTLIDVALRSNPQTRRAWYEAEGAAAQYGQSRSDRYPTVAADAPGGYLKLPIEFPAKRWLSATRPFCQRSKSTTTYSTSAVLAQENVAPANS
jgi:hypothetical protein